MDDVIQILLSQGRIVNLVSYWPSSRLAVTTASPRANLHTFTLTVPSYLPGVLRGFSIVVIVAIALSRIRRCDAIFAHSTSMVSGVPALLLARLTGLPLVVDYLDLRDASTPRIFHERVIRGATLVLAISRVLERDVKSLHCRQVILLPVFADTELFALSQAERVIKRQQLGVTDDEFLLGYTGSFWYVEGVSLLVRAFNVLVRKYPKTKLLLMGGTPTRESEDPLGFLDRGVAKERLILLPPQPRSNVPSYLSACDALCSPKIDCEINRAANPVKVVEYMAMGLPAVCSAVGGIVDIIDDRVDGILAKPGDVSDLERQLEWLIEHKSEAAAIGKKARQKAVALLGYGAASQILERVLSSSGD